MGNENSFSKRSFFYCFPYEGGSIYAVNDKRNEKALLNSPIGSKDGQGKNAKVIVKYFNPCGAGTWLITEGEKLDNGDWLLYGTLSLKRKHIPIKKIC